MQIITTVNRMKEYSRKASQNGKSIGFVPTMGYLHDGHLSLVRAARKECDVVIVSIFVNPTQFGPLEDFDKYPRDIERDKLRLEGENIDVLFLPEADEIYPGGCAIEVKADNSISEVLCGAARPGHFDGVATVVAKLFDVTIPDKSYFGQKDAQQTVVIERMVKDLDLPIEICVEPIIRENDGLAMSSRNMYLSGSERAQAVKLFEALSEAEKLIKGGEDSSALIKEKMKSILAEGKDIEVDYIETVDANSLRSVEEVGSDTFIAIAAFVGKTRLIDNILIK